MGRELDILMSKIEFIPAKLFEGQRKELLVILDAYKKKRTTYKEAEEDIEGVYHDVRATIFTLSNYDLLPSNVCVKMLDKCIELNEWANKSINITEEIRERC